MSTTYSRQNRKFPSSGTTLTRDGAPLHSRIGSDLIVGVNNLSYVEPFAGFVQWFNSKDAGGYGSVSYPAGSAGYMPALVTDGETFTDGEYFLAQLPTVVPLAAAARFCWTLGIRTWPSDSITGNVTIENINLYISRSAYIGQAGIGIGAGNFTQTGHVFDTTKIPSKYTKIVENCAISIPNPTATQAYHLIDHSSGDLAWQPGDLTYNNSFLGLANLIVTADISRTSGGAGESFVGLDLAEFVWWVKPE